MACVAFDLRVRGSQWKFRRLAMIEANRAPLVLVMAAFTPGTVPSGVDVLNLVAIQACGADALVAFTNVTRGTEDSAMGALELEPGPVVVERFDAAPYRLPMTVVARFPKTPLVRIVRLMTIEAAAGGVAKMCGLRVASDTLHRLVSLPKLEIRKCVIERLAVQLDDVGISPLVIGVAMVAFLFRRLRLTSVKSLTDRKIGSNFLVARQAEPTLRPSRKRLVTGTALRLKFGMSGHDRTRHDKLLE
jgi:hypothetical protein